APWPRPCSRRDQLRTGDAPRNAVCRNGRGPLLGGRVEHLLHALAGAGEPVFATAGQRLAALPQRHGLIQRQAARLQPPDDLGELVARLLVAQACDIGVRFRHSSTVAATTPSATRTRSRSPGATSPAERSTGSTGPSVTRCTIA